MSRSRSHSHQSARGQSGFTLLEVLIAFAIMAMALGTLLQVFSTGLRGLQESEYREIALLYARSKLEEVGITVPLEEGLQTGRFENGFRWACRITPLGTDVNRDSDPSVMMYGIEIEVSWSDDDGEASIVVNTARVGPGPP